MGGSKIEGQGLYFFRREARPVLENSLAEVQVHFSELPVLHVFSVRKITAKDGYYTRFEIKGGKGRGVGQED